VIKNIKKKMNLGVVAATVLLSSSMAYAYEKPKIEGFVLRGDVTSGAPGERSHFDNPFDEGANWGNKVDGIVITAEWADLQKTAYGEIESNNVIDQAIATITKWNANKPRSEWIFLKLRVFSGIYSPSWVGENVGSLEVDFKNAKQGTLPYFWTDSFQSYWADFQNKLGERYDNQPLLLDVALSGCMTHNAETMWRNYGSENTTSVEDLKAHGLTVAKDESCLLNQIDIAANAWKSTNISMAINGWKNYDAAKVNGHYPKKIEFAKDMVDHCKDVLGNRCIVGNNSVGNKSADDDEHLNSDKALQYVSSYENDTYVQTTTKAENINKAINYAADSLHASMAELPKLKDLDKISHGFLGSDRMQSARANLKSNDSGTTNVFNQNITSMFRVNSSRAYAVRDDARYSRYNIANDYGDYVANIKGNWPQSLVDNMTKISASFLAPNNTVYIFLNDGTYYRYYYSSDSTAGPFDTAAAWPGISKENAKKIVAALPWKDKKYIYLFLNNGKYIKYNWKYDYAMYTYNITEGLWPGVSAYAKEITGAIKFSERYGYIFLTHNRYLKYDYKYDYASEVRTTSNGWSNLISN